MQIPLEYLAINKCEHLALSSCNSDNPHNHKPKVVDDKHTQHVNSMHHHIRRRLEKYCGISSKYLENYISLFIWLQTIKVYKSLKRQARASLSRAAMPDCHITRKALEQRPAIPKCAA